MVELWLNFGLIGVGLAGFDLAARGPGLGALSNGYPPQELAPVVIVAVFGGLGALWALVANIKDR